MPATVGRRSRASKSNDSPVKTGIATQESPRASQRPSRRAKTIAAQKLDSTQISKPESDDDDEEAASDNDDDDDDDDSDANAGVSMVTPTRTVSIVTHTLYASLSLYRKSTATPKKTGGASSARKTKMPRSTEKRKQKKAANTNSNDPPLFVALIEGDATQELQSWTQRYDEEMFAATAEMIGIFAKCSGCNEVVTKEMLPEIEEACAQLIENFGEESDGYPLAAKAPKDRQFRELLDTFVEQMIGACKATILHDGYFLQTLITWLTTLGSSSVRALRHTATYSALRVGHCIISLKLDLQDQVEITQRQLTAEKKKAGKKASQKLTSLTNQMKSFDNHMGVFDETLENVYSGVIAHRYRDVSPQIRQLSLEELGMWIHRLPDVYLDDTYLKYIGWSLNDKDVNVRNSSLSSLITICSVEERYEALELFTQRFKVRLVNMCEDVSDQVVTNALEMMMVLASMSSLEPDDVDSVIEFVFAENAAQRQNAGKLFVKAIIETEFDIMLEESNQGSDTVLRSPALLKFIVQKITSIGSLFSDCKASYVVDALFDVVPELCDWEAYYALLQQDNRRDDDDKDDDDEQELSNTTLSPKEEMMLFEMMTASALRATEALHLPGRPHNHKLNAKQRQQVQHHSTKITEFFMRKMPDLMLEFGADSEKANLLLQLPQTFDLELYETNRCMKQFDATLVQVRELILKNSDSKVISTAVQTLLAFGDNELALESKTEKAITSLLDTIFKQLQTVLKKGVPEDNDDDDDDDDGLSPASFVLVGALRRMNEFASFVDVSHLDVLSLIGDIVKKGVDDEVHETILSVTLELYLKLIVAKLSKIDENPDEATVEEIAAVRDEYVAHCETLLSAGTELVQRTAYNVIMDCSQVFTPRYKIHGADNVFAKLALTVDDDLQNALFEYLGHFLEDSLTASNADTVELSKKRKQSTGGGRNAKRRSNGDDGDEDEEEDLEAQLERLSLTEALHKKEEANALRMCRAMEMLSAFTAAIAFGAVHCKYLGKLLPFYGRSPDISEIVRYVFGQMREHDAQGLNEGLISGLEEMFVNTRDAEDNSMIELKELAHRLALTYGIDLKKNATRTSIISIHRRGIDFALSGGKNDETGLPENLFFLEILKEFSIKLHKQDKSGNNSVMEYLKTALRGLKLKPVRDDEGWGPFYIFADSLDRTTGTRTSSAHAPPSSQKKGGVKRKSSKTPTPKKRGKKSLSLPRGRSSQGTARASNDGFWGVIKQKKRVEGIDDDEEEEEEDDDDDEEEADPLQDYATSEDDDDDDDNTNGENNNQHSNNSKWHNTNKKRHINNTEITDEDEDDNGIEDDDDEDMEASPPKRMRHTRGPGAPSPTITNDQYDDDDDDEEDDDETVAETPQSKRRSRSTSNSTNNSTPPSKTTSNSKSKSKQKQATTRVSGGRRSPRHSIAASSADMDEIVDDLDISAIPSTPSTAPKRGRQQQRQQSRQQQQLYTDSEQEEEEEDVNMNESEDDDELVDI